MADGMEKDDVLESLADRLNRELHVVNMNKSDTSQTSKEALENLASSLMHNCNQTRNKNNVCSVSNFTDNCSLYESNHTERDNSSAIKCDDSVIVDCSNNEQETFGDIVHVNDSLTDENLTDRDNKETEEANTDIDNKGDLRDTGMEGELAQGKDDAKVEEEANEGEHTFQTDEESQSGSEAEYESAEEGEEIQVDKQNLRDLEETLSEEQKEEKRIAAQLLKDEGNEFFRTGSYKTAIRTYSRALRTCPLKYAKDRAIMYSNRAACKMRLEDFEESIRDCSKALELHPYYMKALMRRAELYEKTEKLDEALADYQKILELDPTQHSARAACMRLPDQIKERNDKLKEEMMGKLKELGNMILRPFGLSTNNFQMNQDPQTGGYSVNFVQNPKPN